MDGNQGVTSQEAELDLESIADFIARDSSVAALEFIAELRSKCLDLADFPYRFPMAEAVSASGIRKRVHKNYLIFYIVDGEFVHVLHVLHGAIDTEAWLGTQ